MSNFGIRYLVAYLFKKDIPKYLISISAILAFFGMIFAAFKKMLKIIGSNYNQIDDAQSATESQSGIVSNNNLWLIKQFLFK